MGKFLDHKQKKQLELELRRERGRKHADRIRVILLLDMGETYSNISKFLFLDEGTIANYRKRYKDGRIEELLNDSHQGSTAFLSIEQILQLEIHLLENLYVNIKGIINYIQKKFGVNYTRSGIKALLKRMGFTYKKPKPFPGKAKIDEQKNFIVEYEQAKSEGKVYFSDSVHPHHNPILSYGWIKKGLEMELPTNTGRDRINIAGAVTISGSEVITKIFDTINAEAICELMTLIREKNPDNNRISLILDNAPYNRSKSVKDFAYFLKIELIYLPSYSPNLNIIERLWKFFKKNTLYNTYYKTFTEFIKASKKFFKEIHKYDDELKTLLTENFQLTGT